jgi:hypothetical protein
MNPTNADQRERSHSDEEPEKDSLKEWSNSHFAERLHRESRPNQKERYGQADASKMLEHWIGGLEHVDVSIENSRETEEENEPGPLNARLALVCHSGSDRKRYDP